MFQGSSAWHWIGAINKQALARIGSTKQRYTTLCMARYWRPIYICEKAHARGGYMSRRSYRSKAQAHAIPSGQDHDDIDMAGKRVILALFTWAMALLPIFMPHGT